MHQVLLRGSFRVMVLLSAFLIAIGLSTVVKHRRSSMHEQRCIEVPTAESVTPPCKHADYSLLPSLTYCDLVASPAAYENKLVRLRLGYLSTSGRVCFGVTNTAPRLFQTLIWTSLPAPTILRPVGLMSAWNEELLPRNNIFW